MLAQLLDLEFPKEDAIVYGYLALLEESLLHSSETPHPDESH